LFPDFPAAGAVYYRESSEPQAWPWFQDELAILAAGATPERTFEAQLETVHGLCVFQVKMKRMLDVSEKFSGTVVILSDITARKRYEERLNHLARHDPLTGLLNRHALLEILDQESKRSKRYRRPIGVLMADVNRFKEINDEFGHPVGDEVLKSLATIFMQQVRESAIAIRYGGDEFLVLLLETGRQVELVRSRIVKAVERWSNTQTLTDFPVTLSIGAAYWDVGSQASLDEALAIADRQMYAAKQDSRAAMTG
jgi:diguanylate cyclase (GGDEF)-like protein